MADKANFEGIKRAGADITEDDSQCGDNQDPGFLLRVAHA